jgi:DNA-binding transcriptional ArsR family regulator
MQAAAVDLDALGRIGTALADETRRQLLVRLLDEPRYPAELAEVLGLTKANVSNHLACLRGCGLVTTTPEGRRVRYELADPRFAAALAQLAELALPPAEGCLHERRDRS